MAGKRVFISFDFDHDQDLKNLLVGQARNPDTPFEIQDFSVKEPMAGDWKAAVRTRIRRTELTIVICGASTNTATGVAAELTMTREAGNPYFLLHGRANETYAKPTTAAASDKVYRWTWDNLKSLIGGNR